MYTAARRQLGAANDMRVIVRAGTIGGGIIIIISHRRKLP